MTAQEDFSFDLGDDGTLDTVVVVTCNRCGESWEWRYDLEVPDGLNENENWDRVESALEQASLDVDDEGCPKCDGGV